MNAPTQLAAMKTGDNTAMPDTRVDMFSMRGFALAQRIASAFATSDAVPAQFRSYQLKKVGQQEQWVENPAAMGNCIVAIEVAQAVGMSVTAVMQNADVIEGKLRWSDRFVVAGINASRRFTPLRFDVKNLGPVEATYKEKTGWDNAARKPIFTERSVKLDNYQSIAWALPHGFSVPAGIYTLDQARAASLPVIEGPPVSMKLAVEEGWYGKPGSKWQTELKHKMLMMRSGRFFGDIHAPDIVMGIGRTSDEERDVIDLAPQADGSYSVDLASLKSDPPPQSPPQEPGEVIEQNSSAGSGEQSSAQAQQGGEGAASLNPSGAPTFEDAVAAVNSGDIDTARDIARSLSDAQRQQIETAIANRQVEQQQGQAQGGTRSRRGTGSTGGME